MAAITATFGPASEVAFDTKRQRNAGEESWRATCLPQSRVLVTGEYHFAGVDCLEELISHITHVHHRRLRKQLAVNWAMLDEIFIEVEKRYLPSLSLLPIGKAFESLLDTLVDCMTREERFVFPQIKLLESSLQKSCSGQIPFELLNEGILALERSQLTCLLAVRKLNELSGQVDPTIQQCAVYREFVGELAKFSSDAFQYLFEVNCLLLNRAKAMIRAQRKDWRRETSSVAHDRRQVFVPPQEDDQPR